MPKIQASKQTLFLNLPKDYTQLLGWKRGDLIACFPDNQNKQTLILKKVEDAEKIKPRQKAKTWGD